MAQALQERTVPQAAETPPIPGVIVMEPREVRFQRRVTLLATVLPFIGFIVAIIMTWGNGLSATSASIALGFYLFTGLGITIGYHRYFTHGSFETNRFMHGLFAIAGSMAVQGSVISWVADHRRHHAYADKEGDPHSPHLEDGPGLAGVVKGLWHAHLGWLFAEEGTVRERWAPDLLKDPLMVRIDRAFPWLVVLTFALPPVIGFAVTGTFAGALAAAIWGSLVRVFFLHHVTWSINSICHFYGKRPFESDDFSTNNWPLSLLSFGESWHNNHHAFPTSAVHGIGKGQVDMAGSLIRLFEKVHLVSNVKTPTEKQLRAKAAAAAGVAD
jgi:stearoyl-CoA desaturase (delta-9 desaturase)